MDAAVVLTAEIPALKLWIWCLVTCFEDQVQNEDLTSKMQFPYHFSCLELRGEQTAPSQAHCSQLSLSRNARHIRFPAFEVQAACLSSPISRDFPFRSTANPSFARPVSQPQSRPDCHFQTISSLPPVSGPWLLFLGVQSSKGLD